jgi:hypothetical protein
MDTPEIVVNLAEWPYKERADELRERVVALLADVSSKGRLNMSRLEGISVVESLNTALRSFDAGYPGDHSAAMRETVMGRMITTFRDSEIRGHIFLPVDVALQLINTDAPHRDFCTYAFVHECAHLHDLDQWARAFGTDILRPPLAQPLFLSLQVCWNEYAACRLAAYSYPGQTEDMRAALHSAIEKLGDARSRTNAAFAPTDEGRQSGLTAALNDALPYLQAFSYLLGHCKGLGIPFAQNVPENYFHIQNDPRLQTALQRIELQLDALWAIYGEWSSFEALTALVQAICEFVMASTGLVMRPAPDRGMQVALLRS